MIDYAWQSKARRQIVRSNQHAIDTVHAHDRFDIGDGIPVLGLHDDGGVVVGALHVFPDFQPIAVRPRDAEPALTDRGVFRGLHDASRMIGGVDLRDDDPGRTDIERLLDRHIVTGCEADHARR